MRKSILLYPLFLIAIQLSAQDLHIYFDAETELLRYESDGQPIPQPKAQSGSHIFLHIENYNNYLFDVEIGTEETTINIPASNTNTLTGLLSGKGLGMPALNLFSAEEKPMLSMGKEITLEEAEEGAELAHSQEEGAAAKKRQALSEINQKYTQNLYALTTAETNLIRTGKTIKQEFQKKQILNIVAKEVTKLKRHPHLKPTQIKQMVSEYFQTIFDTDEITAIDMDYILEQTILQNQLEKLKEQEAIYQKELDKLGTLVKVSAQFNFDNPDLINTLQQTHKNSEEFLEKAQADQKKLTELTSQFEQEDMKNLSDLRYEFEAINSNDFSHTYRTTAKEDAVVFNIKFKKKELGGNEVVSNKTIAPIEVGISGGFKLNASLGLSFGTFSETPQDYFVRDETIKSDDIGGLKPLLTSFLHFYKQSNENTSFGGSIGVGFPLAGDRSITSLSFLAGPALVIGKSSRIVISSGLMTGQVNRLAQGYQIGDTFISEVDNVPIKQVYKLGYFFGISYNL